MVTMSHYLVCPHCGENVAVVAAIAPGVKRPPLPTEHSQAVREVVGEYMHERVRANPGGRVPTALLRRDFEAWAEANGKPPVSARALGIALRELGVKPYRSSGARYYADILVLS